MPLSNKENFFEAILSEHTGDIVVFNINHEYVYVNPHAIKNPETRRWIIGKTDHEYCEYRKIDPVIAQKRHQFFEKIIAEKREIEWEEILVDQSGESRYYLKRLTPVFSGFGKISFVIGSGIEITDRMKMRLEIENRKNFIDQVINTSPHLIYVKDAEGRFLLVNQSMADLFDTDIESLVKKSNEEVHPNKAETDAYSIIDHKVISAKKQIRLDESFTKKDGEVIWFDTIKVPLIEQDGTVNVLGISSEITDFRKVNERAILNKKRLSAAEELSKSGNWEYDFVNNKLEWSSGMYKIWEIEKDSEIPRSMYEIHDDDKEKVRSEITRVRQSGIQSIIDFRIILPSGMKYLRNISKPLFNENKEVFRLFGTVRDITSEKITESLLLENEMRLNEVQELVAMGSFSFDVTTQLIKWSAGCFKIFKYHPEAGILSYEDYLRFVHPDDLDYLNKMLAIVHERDKPFDLSYRIICSDGEVKLLHIINKLHFDSDGNIIKVVGSIADVTEQRKAEEILLHNEQRLNEAQELNRTGSWEYDLKNKINTWSKGHYKLWERNPELPAPNFEEFLLTIHPDDRIRMNKSMEVAFKTKEELSIEYRIATYNGINKTMLSKAVIERDVNDVPTRIFGTVVDITDRKINEERLRLSEQRLLEAQEMAHFGSWQVDINSGKAEWSMGTYRIWERDPKLPALSLEEVYETITPDDRERLMATISDAMENKKSFDIKYKININGKIKYVNGRGKVGRNEFGDEALLYGTILDISETKNFEEELIHANNSAAESLRAKEYFLANVSHELRTPINGVLGMARLLQKTELSSTQRNYIDILGRTADNLLVIINDILDAAKIESGKLSFEKIAFIPERVADTVVQTQLYKAEEKDIFIRHMMDASPMPPVIGDPLRLNQILLNLISNAIKFTVQGEITVTHKITEENSENVVIEFSVKDTGIGIPLAEQEKIFESFTQLQGHNSNPQEGTGLGLTISRSLVEKQGGKIWVESKPGKGSTFSFYIPYKKADDIPEIKSTKRIAPGQLGALRVLLAEDNRVNQFITEAMLQDWGFKIDVASNGKEAVDLVERNSYDIILMDIQMPEMNGVEATHLIRAMKDKEKSKLPIIALTANTTRQTHKKFVAEGMNDCLVKPFQEEALFKKIVAHLDGKEKIQAALQRPRFPTRKRPKVSEESLYNLSLLKRDARDKPEFISRMLILFIETIPPIIEKMNDHFEKGEMDAISTLAHKIKPTLHSAGIISLGEAIKNIEAYRDKKRSPGQLKNDLSNLNEVIAKVLVAFQKEISSIQSGNGL